MPVTSADLKRLSLLGSDLEGMSIRVDEDFPIVLGELLDEIHQLETRALREEVEKEVASMTESGRGDRVSKQRRK